MMTLSDLKRRENASLVKSAAIKAGFLACGVAQVRRLNEEEDRLGQWLTNGQHGEMAYMANHFEVRLNPDLLLPGAKTVVSLAYNYYTEATQSDTNAPKISMYAHGRDYHKVLKKKLKEFVNDLQTSLGAFAARVFVDSAPIMEKKWAQLAGLGWVGKHTNLINKSQGSYFFLCEIITDLDLEPDEPFTQDHCGTCTRCIDACPTDAIHEPYKLDASKCISYLTIELKNAIPEDFSGKMEGWAFGCDICQQVCPWNRFSLPHQQSDFNMKSALKEMSAGEWHEMTREVFDEVFEGSPVKRTGYDGLMRNIQFLKKKS
jgi:epoxyqueuosine reductase